MGLINDGGNSSYQSSATNTLIEEKSGSLPGSYHTGELKIHNRINNTAIGIIIAGFIMICSAFVYMILTKKLEIGIITTIAGIITEFISGMLFRYVAKSSEDKWKYFNILNENEEEKMLLEEIRLSQNVKFKEKMIEKLVDTYCKVKQK